VGLHSPEELRHSPEEKKCYPKQLRTIPEQLVLLSGEYMELLPKASPHSNEADFAHAKSCGAIG